MKWSIFFGMPLIFTLHSKSKSVLDVYMLGTWASRDIRCINTLSLNINLISIYLSSKGRKCDRCGRDRTIDHLRGSATSARFTILLQIIILPQNWNLLFENLQISKTNSFTWAFLSSWVSLSVLEKKKFIWSDKDLCLGSQNTFVNSTSISSIRVEFVSAVTGSPNSASRKVLFWKRV